MALEGTLKDFSLADIFQLISLQKKSGVLTLKKENEMITVSFISGMVVSADALPKRMEDRLGTVLVKSGMLSKEQLEEALQTQRNTLQRLGYILSNGNYLAREQIRRALEVQITQMIYRLFCWKDGEYKFNQEEKVEFDKENFTPLSAESLLMEGIRLLDEWPIIQRKIRSLEMVFEKAPLEEGVVVGPEEPEDEFVAISFDATEEKETDLGAEAKPGASSQKIPLSPNEATVYHLVDGQFTVQEIIWKAQISDFEGCRIFYDLLNRELIRERQMEAAPTPAAPVAAPAKRARGAIWVYALIPLALAGLAGIGINPANPLLGYQPFRAAWSPMQDVITRHRLEAVSSALQVYSLDNEEFPRSLFPLVDEHYLAEPLIQDARGRDLVYEAIDDDFLLQGLDPRGQPDPRLQFTLSYRSAAAPTESAAEPEAITVIEGEG